MTKSKKNKKKIWIIVILVILLIIIAGFLVKLVIVEPIKDKVATQVIEKVLDSEIADDSTQIGNTSAKELYNSMDETDQEALKTIVTNHFDTDTVSKASEYLASGDKEGLKEYAKSKLDENDMETVKKLYEKYKNKIQP